MMSKILVIQHVAGEGLGIIEKVLGQKEIEPHLIRVFRGDRIPKVIQGYGGLIVLGGPMGAYEDGVYPFIKDELALIKNALKTDIPILGICLGSQLLARSAGANVYKGKKKEIGWYTVRLTDEGKRDPLFIGLPDEFTVFQWHGDTFDVPQNGKCLASSELFPHQIIKAGKKAYSLQFHLEVTEKMIQDWIDVNDKELASVKAYINPENILKAAPKNIEPMNEYGKVVFRRFFNLID